MHSHQPSTIFLLETVLLVLCQSPYRDLKFGYFIRFLVAFGVFLCQKGWEIIRDSISEISAFHMYDFNMSSQNLRGDFVFYSLQEGLVGLQMSVSFDGIPAGEMRNRSIQALLFGITRFPIKSVPFQKSLSWSLSGKSFFLS